MSMLANWRSINRTAWNAHVGLMNTESCLVVVEFGLQLLHIVQRGTRSENFRGLLFILCRVARIARGGGWEVCT